MPQDEKKIIAILADVLRVSPGGLTDGLKLSDVELWDSLRHMDLIATLEQELSLTLTYEEILAMQSVGTVKDVVLRKLGGCA